MSVLPPVYVKYGVRCVFHETAWHNLMRAQHSVLALPLAHSLATLAGRGE